MRDTKILVNPIVRNISRLGNLFRYSFVVRFGPKCYLIYCVVAFSQHSTLPSI